MTDYITARETAHIAGISYAHTLRLLRADAFPGAHKTIPSVRGDWRVPRASAKGYKPQRRRLAGGKRAIVPGLVSVLGIEGAAQSLKVSARTIRRVLKGEKS